ncbi:unnamed protein product, partial [Staurois parvus]
MSCQSAPGCNHDVLIVTPMDCLCSMCQNCCFYCPPEAHLFHRLFSVWARTQGPHDPLLPGGP